MDISISTTIFIKGGEELCSFTNGLDMLVKAGFRKIEISRKHDNIMNRLNLKSGRK